MKSEVIQLYLSCVLWLSITAGCAVPQYFWPQKDIAGSYGRTMPGERTVLIASRGSEYKQQLVAELQKQLSAARISHKTIGVSQLKEVDPTGYAAVVVINTCLAKGLDHDVHTFLDSQQTTANIILLTTSAKGSWLPNKRGLDFDAISGASAKANIGDVAQDLMEKIRAKL